MNVVLLHLVIFSLSTLVVWLARCLSAWWTTRQFENQLREDFPPLELRVNVRVMSSPSKPLAFVEGNCLIA